MALTSSETLLLPDEGREEELCWGAGMRIEG